MRIISISLLLVGVLLAVPAHAGDRSPTDSIAGSVVHPVSETDTFDSVSKLYGVSAEELKNVNGSEDLRDVKSLVIPPAASGWPLHQVRPGETLWRIGKAYGISVDQLRQANGMQDNRLLPGNILVLPRADKPQWSPPPVATETATEAASEPASETAAQGPAPSEVPPQKAAPSSLGEWVEVRLADNRRAWVRSESLVLGSWQPKDPVTLLSIARRFVGVPYRWGGTNPNGYDCSGFVQEVFRLSGHSVPRMADAQYEELEKVTKDELSPGDLVFFNTDGSGVSHVGIFSGEGRFLHASSSRGVIESYLDEDYYSSRYVGAARIPEWLNQLTMNQK